LEVFGILVAEGSEQALEVGFLKETRLLGDGDSSIEDRLAAGKMCIGRDASETHLDIK
jgi:hypothetical protein